MYLVEYVPRSAALLKAMPALSGADMVAPSGPGFGLELNDDAVTRYTVETT
jgi:L-alanine-DL-glutamate epimerase-like enolase superfamily enzyme